MVGELRPPRAPVGRTFPFCVGRPVDAKINAVAWEGNLAFSNGGKRPILHSRETRLQYHVAISSKGPMQCTPVVSSEPQT